VIRVTWIALAWLGIACSSESPSKGIEQPVQVLHGQFVEGTFPGLPPIVPGSGETPVPPTVTNAQNAGGILELGDPKRDITGRTTDDAYSVAFGVEGLGTGYWLVPVRGKDAANPGELTFSFVAQYSRAIVPGDHRVLFAALGPNGESGTQLDVKFCMSSELPDNGNTCNPALPPPKLVVSLGWDRNVDLDLQVLTPAGVLVDTKHRSTAPNEDATGEPGVGTIDFDSNAGCVIDGHRRESLVFQETPPSGDYWVYANLFDACNEDSVRFTLTLNEARDAATPGQFDQVETYRTNGILVASQANGGAKVGLLLTKFVIP
jgi:hypothetical protein